MRAAEFGAIALGIVAVWSSACSKSSNTAQGSKTPSASNTAPAQQQHAQQQPAIGGGPTEPGAAQAPATPKGAVSSLAAAQCDREVRCKKVGQNETYKTRDECVSKVQHDKGQSINDKACTGGINQGNFNECIKALQEEECGNPMSTLQRMSACKTDSLCVKKKK
jgi:hypothetical protein